VSSLPLREDSPQRDSLPSNSSRRFAALEPVGVQRLEPVAGLQALLEEARRRTGATGAAIAMRAAGGLSCVARSGDTVPELGTRLDPASGLTGLCYRTGKSLVCNDSENDSRVNPLACRVLNVRSVVVVPIRSEDGGVIGILELLSQAPNAFGEAEFVQLSHLKEWLPQEQDSQHLDQTSSSGQRDLQETPAPAIPSSLLPYKSPEIQSLFLLPLDSELPPKPAVRKLHFTFIPRRGLRIGVAALLVVSALIAYNRDLKGIVRASANFSGVNQVKQPSDPYIFSSGAAPPNSVADTSQILADIKGPVSSASLGSLFSNASAGNSQAQYELGLRYADGAGVVEDYRQAMQWFLSAALKRHAMAEWKVGLGYLSGIGVQKDPRAAVEWFKKAANQDHAAAQLMLSQLYHTGIGVKKDSVRAFTWASIASRPGSRETRQLRELRASLTPMQLDDANRRITAWWQNHDKAN
jgi:hypothetical protein